MRRKIIEINEELCDGCGICVPECNEGALKVIDGKARLISDLFCDGLGACLGRCPKGALSIEEREAEPYDENKVMDYIARSGNNVIKAHLEHLRDHNEMEYFRQALKYLDDKEIPLPVLSSKDSGKKPHACPGSQETVLTPQLETNEEGKRKSHLTQWPIQMHLVSPGASYYRKSDLLLAADCCAFSYADFHKDFLNGKSLAIACPKLDANKQVYLEKLTAMINEAKIKSITVMIMEVPCCGGLLQLAQHAAAAAEREVPISVVAVGLNGDIIKHAAVN